MIRFQHLKAAITFVFLLALSSVATLNAEGIDTSPGNHIKNEGGCLVYVGTYTGAKSKGIYACRMNLENGALTSLGLVAETPNPTFLAVDPKHRFLFAVNEIGRYEDKPAGSISAYAFDPESGKLTLLNRHSAIGSGPCHLVLDRAGRNVLAANYGSGSVTVLPVQSNGELGDDTAFVQHTGKSINPGRQQGPHAHCLALDAANRFALACDLGLDKIMIYRFDSARGTLTPNEPAFAPVKAGSGPRHMAFSPDNLHAYVINELSSTITVFVYDSRHGALKELQTVPTLPEDFKGDNLAAEIAVHPSGKFLYGSNRGHDSIAVFAIDRAKGTLTLVEREAMQGKTPRHFAIDPTGRYLLAANQDSNSLTVFAIEGNTGRLMETGATLEVPTPTCVMFAPSAGRDH